MANNLGEYDELPVRRLESVPGGAKTLIAAFLAVGALAFVAALFAAPARAWQAYLYNWLFWTSIAQGAVVLAAAVVMTRGLWARPVRRIALSFVAFLPIAFVLMLPLFLVGDIIFPWVGEDLHARKDLYLNMPFLVARNVVSFGALVVLSLLFAYWALRPDAGLLRERVPERLRGLYDRLSRDWRGQEAEELRAHRKLNKLAPALALVYAVAFSFFSFDFVMSLEPHWFSTLIGPYYFMGAFLGGIAAATILAIIYREALGLQEEIALTQLHDLGKLVFAFAIFWGYMFWGQFIVIWYGLLPHEQIFLIHRMDDPFIGLSMFVLFSLFIFPFTGLLGVKPKKTPAILATLAGVVVFGLWIERYVLTYPSWYVGAEELLPFGWPEIGVSLGFAGLFLAALLAFATRFPLFQLWEHASELELMGETSEIPGGEGAVAE